MALSLGAFLARRTGTVGVWGASLARVASLAELREVVALLCLARDAGFVGIFLAIPLVFFAVFDFVVFVVMVCFPFTARGVRATRTMKA